jgi:hypothetical protein
METKITRNYDEHSVTVRRGNGEKVDFVGMKDEIVIGQTLGDEHTHIVLSIDEAKELQSHLSNVIR